MIRTLLVYDGKMSSAERIAERLSYLIGNAKVCEISEIPSDLSVYEGYCLVFNFYGAVTAARETNFLRAHHEEMSECRIAMVGIGFSDLGFMNYIVNLEKTTGLSGIEGYFLTRESETDRIGSEIEKFIRRPEHAMEEEKLSSEIDTFVRAHNTLALATATEGYLRNTPLEYLYRKGLFYIITEGGNKFRGILDNGKFCATIFDNYTQTGSTKGLQITGEAKIVPVGSGEYYETMKARKVTKAQLAGLPVTLFMIKLVPMKYEMLNSDFKKDGYDVYQSMRTSFQQKHWEAGAVFAQASAAKKNEERTAAVPVQTPAGQNVKKKKTEAPAWAEEVEKEEQKTVPNSADDRPAPVNAGEEKEDKKEEPVDEDQAARAAMVASILKSEGRDGTELYTNDGAETDGSSPNQDETDAPSEVKKSRPSIAKTFGDAIKGSFRKHGKKSGKEAEDSEEAGVSEYYDDEDDEKDFDDDFDFADDEDDEDEVFDSYKD